MKTRTPRFQSRPLVVVLGMHRSGTSALAGALSIMGVDFGSNLMSAVDGVNERGFWEDRVVVDRHEQILDLLGSTWDDIRDLPSARWDLLADSEPAKGLDRYLSTVLARGKIIGQKDPRLSLLLPLWFSLPSLQRADYRFVLSVRHPAEVADSLAKRDGFSRAKSSVLFLRHYLAAEKGTRALRRKFVYFPELVRSCRQTVDRIVSELIPEANPPPEAGQNLERFLTAELHRHRWDSATPSHSLEPAYSLACELHEELQQACETGGEPEAARLDAIAEQLRTLPLQELYDEHIAALSRRTGAQRLAMERLETELKDRGAWGHSLEQDLAKARSELIQQNEDNNEKSAWGKKLEAELDEARVTIAQNVAVIEERSAWGHSLEAELDRAREQLQSVERETVERTTWAGNLAEELKKAHGELNRRSEQVRSLEAELHRDRDQFALLQRSFQERSDWAHTLSSEVGDLRALVQQQAALLDERSRWGQSLDEELHELRLLAIQRAELIEVRSAWAQTLQSDLESLRTKHLELSQAFSQQSEVLADKSQANAALQRKAAEHELALMESEHRIAQKAGELLAERATAQEWHAQARILRSEVARLAEALTHAQSLLDHFLRDERRYSLPTSQGNCGNGPA